MTTHRARHRTPAGSPPASAPRPARELIARLSGEPAPATISRRHRARSDDLPRPRYDIDADQSYATAALPTSHPYQPARGSDRLPTPAVGGGPHGQVGAHRHRAGGPARGTLARPGLARQSTLALMAAGAVGAGAAMTGSFPAVTDHDAPEAPDLTHAQPLAMGDALVPATSGPAATDAAPASLKAPAAAPTGTMSDALTPSVGPAPATFTGGQESATVLAEDTQRTDARQIAALARSVGPQAGAAVADGLPKPTSALGGLGVVSAVTGAAAPAAALDLVPGAARRASAMGAAMSKLGVPYVWGAAGPRAFDCSGLMLWAYKKVGISLPHSSRAQSQMGQAVAKKDLRPGDLVFFYSPVSHVGMYIGNGKILHASEPGQPVKISDLNRFPFHNARRL